MSDTETAKLNGKICGLCGFVAQAFETVCPADGTPLKLGATQSLIGTILAGKYRVESLLGSGGMGSVYKAEQVLLKKTVALKVLHGSMSADEPARIKRFRQEGVLISSLDHPNIIRARDFDIAGDQAFLVLDYIEGENLWDAIKNRGRLPIGRALNIFNQVCDALGYAHAQNVIHRDIKPSNIMLTRAEDGSEMVKLLDFGVAKWVSPDADENAQHLTKTGVVFGSPPYMSPEQCLGQTPDARSDIYSFGCVMYHTLTGHGAIDGDNSLEILHKQISDPPLRFSALTPSTYVPASFESVVFKALEKKPEDRYQTMEALKVDLLKAASDHSFNASGIQQKPRARWLEVGVLAASVLMLSSGVGFYFYYDHLKSQNKTQANADSDKGGSVTSTSTYSKNAVPSVAVTTSPETESAAVDSSKPSPSSNAVTAESPDTSISQVSPTNSATIDSQSLTSASRVALLPSSERRGLILDQDVTSIGVFLNSRQYNAALATSKSLYKRLRKDRQPDSLARLSGLFSSMHAAYDGLKEHVAEKAWFNSELATARTEKYFGLVEALRPYADEADSEAHAAISKGELGALLDRADDYSALSDHQLGNRLVRKAEESIRQALRLREQASSKGPLYAVDLSKLSHILMRQMDAVGAEKSALEALKIMQTQPDNSPRDLAIVTSRLGDAYRAQQRYSDAEAHYVKALQWWQQTDDMKSIPYAFTLDGLGTVYSQTKRPAKAAPVLAKAADVYDAVESAPATIIGTRKRSGDAYFVAHDWDNATKQFDVALKLGNTPQLRGPYLGPMMERKAMIYIRKGDFANAEKYAEQAIAFWNSIGVQDRALRMQEMLKDARERAAGTR